VLVIDPLRREEVAGVTKGDSSKGDVAVIDVPSYTGTNGGNYKGDRKS